VRVALYTRVSTEDQAKEGFSLPAQIGRLRLFAQAQGWENAGEYIDEGHSGRNIRRPAYKRMMQERDRWDAVLVLKMDRIHRNMRNFMTMMEDLDRDGKQFASVMEALDTSTAMGRFFMDMLQRMAQLESEQISERVLLGMEQKAQQEVGIALNAVPYGYRRLPDRTIVIEEAEARVVRRMFAWAATMNPNRIAKRLTAEGVVVPHPNSKRWPRPEGTRKPSRWNQGTVQRILTSRFYLGERRWANVVTPNNHPAITDEASFLKAGQTVEAFATTYRPDLRVAVPDLPPKPLWTPANDEEAKAQPKPYTNEDGRIPYGYRIGDGGEWVVEPGSALVIQKAFAWAAAGSSGAAIARTLNSQQVPPPAGKRWSPAHMYNFFDNHHYLGERKTYGITIPHHHPPLVTPEVFALAQKSGRRRKHRDQALSAPQPTADEGIPA
jgi:site-specific DNA recombinase